jgi:hypothetical protein
MAASGAAGCVVWRTNVQIRFMDHFRTLCARSCACTPDYVCTAVQTLAAVVLLSTHLITCRHIDRFAHRYASYITHVSLFEIFNLFAVNEHRDHTNIEKPHVTRVETVRYKQLHTFALLLGYSLPKETDTFIKEADEESSSR